MRLPIVQFPIGQFHLLFFYKPYRTVAFPQHYFSKTLCPIPQSDKQIMRQLPLIRTLLSLLLAVPAQQYTVPAKSSSKPLLHLPSVSYYFWHCQSNFLIFHLLLMKWHSLPAIPYKYYDRYGNIRHLCSVPEAEWQNSLPLAALTPQSHRHPSRLLWNMLSQWYSISFPAPHW